MREQKMDVLESTPNMSEGQKESFEFNHRNVSMTLFQL